MSMASRTARAPASARSCWWRSTCCRSSARTSASRRITSTTCFKGSATWPAPSAPIRCAAAATTTTCRCCSAISSPPRPAPASCTSRPSARRGGLRPRPQARIWKCRTRSATTARSTPWVPLFAGVHVYKASDPVCAALDEAGGLLARGKLVHSYPHSWRSKAPLIFRATPQWFIRLDGPERIREKALRGDRRDAFRAGAGTQPARLDGRRAAGLVHQPPARLGRADHRVRRQAHRRAAARSSRGARIVEAFSREGADAWYSSPPSRFLGNDRNPDDYEQVMDIVDVWFEVRLDPRVRAGGARTCPGRPICTSKAPTSIAAGSIRRCWKRSARAAWRRSRRC